MESAGVRYLHTSCFCIRNRTSERSERVRFILNLSKMLKFAATHQEITMNSFLVETFLKNINDGKDTVR